MTAKAEDRLMTARELATYMHLNERTVLRLAAEGGLPGVKIAGQWRFKREVIDAWLVARMSASSDEAGPLDPATIPDGTRVPLADLLDAEAVIADLQARDRAQTIESLVQKAFERGFVTDKPWLIGAL